MEGTIKELKTVIIHNHELKRQHVVHYENNGYSIEFWGDQEGPKLKILFDTEEEMQEFKEWFGTGMIHNRALI